MSYRVVRARAFERSLERFLSRHRDLGPQVAGVLRDLEADPFQPHLRLHGLRGELAGLFAVRLTYGYRITLELNNQAQTITLLDIGSHDEVHR